MGTGINPKVDCVFKAIFGSEENKDVLIHLLNAVLMPEPDQLIVSVEILNPYNDRTFEDGKSSIVDIKAKDQMERSLQIEMQIQSHPGIKERMLWTWTDIYHRQLHQGQQYKLLNPTISIWFLDESLFEVEDQYLHNFVVMERHRKEILTNHFDLHVIEMQKWTSSLRSHKDIDLWLKFLNYGDQLESDQLPAELNIPVIQKAMSTLTRFSQSDKEHDLYVRRLEFMCVENSWKEGLAEAQRNEKIALQRAEAEAKRAEKAEQGQEVLAKRAAKAEQEIEDRTKKAAIAEQKIADLEKALAEFQKAQH